MRHAACVQWGDEALCYRYYKGLPNHFQDLLSAYEAGNPWTYIYRNGMLLPIQHDMQ
jgi:hypothetical protein